MIQGALIRCQVRIEAQERRYTAEEQAALDDLFGEPRTWERTLRPLLWTHAAVTVPAFDGETHVELVLPCSYDLTVASARYFHGLAGGEAPLLLLFSGTVFHAREDGALQAAQVSWSREARYRLPVRVWKEMMDRYYPNSVSLMLRRDVFERLHRHRARLGLATWEAAVESLLSESERGAS